MAKSSSGGGYRSVISGRYVTSQHGRRSPHTTVFESSGPKGSSGGTHRSAITGQYVSEGQGQRNPRTTERNSWKGRGE